MPTFSLGNAAINAYLKGLEALTEALCKRACVIDVNGQETKKVVETPDDLFHLGWIEERVLSLGLYVD